ncbi:transcriptional repressor LexA [Polaromonas sp.]|uniref:transcriptional repressor LexA n=1 Tax=Polaromonas sp. TaxID=1869339 RepID=UPI0013BC0E3E|nr:transcriptional repressor LexA [Polaromonas sp.]NDP63085.1 transcriptional repressor LexA [Polaromonas sp.]
MSPFTDFSGLSPEGPRLTARQAQILELIRNAIARTGAPPTRAEIATELGFRSPNAAEEHLRALAKKGVIELVSGTSRGIRLRTPALQAIHASRDVSRMHPLFSPLQGLGRLALPLVGRVAAGSPILAQEHIERTYQVEPSLFSQTPDYLLTVRGMSMQGAGILDGDLLGVKQASEAVNGQIVVARLGEEVTVKRFHRTRRGIELLPENPDFEPIVVRPGEPFALEGLAVGLIRTRMAM